MNGDRAFDRPIRRRVLYSCQCGCFPGHSLSVMGNGTSTIEVTIAPACPSHCSPETHEDAVLVVEIDNPVRGALVGGLAEQHARVHLEPVAEDVEGQQSQANEEEVGIHGAHQREETRRRHAVRHLRETLAESCCARGQVTWQAAVVSRLGARGGRRRGAAATRCAAHHVENRSECRRLVEQPREAPIELVANERPKV